ncbi:peptidoglycan DD-metalloendopeptidase family protein [Pseudoalteromonas phenolica]|uniref:M23 family metallopeptidase n=1 Tax=Pseudoalteromonas phenolica TaxID=161398 RepID=UPI003850F83C
MALKRLLLLSALLVGCADNEQQAQQSDARPAQTQAEENTATEQLSGANKHTSTDSAIVAETEPKEPTFTVNTYTLKRGQTITHVLKEAGFSLSQIYALANEVKPLFNFKKIKSGTQFDVVIFDSLANTSEPHTNGELAQADTENTAEDSQRASEKRLRFASNFGELIEATLRDGKWQLEQISVKVEQRRFSKSFEISQSLYKAASEADIPANVINSAILAMSHFVDFQREIRSGDKITLNFSHAILHEDTHLFSQFSAPQKLVAIEFVNNKDSYQLYQFEDAYYFADGKLAQNFLMKTPLNGARLSSSFGKRKHPVLGYNRQHKGIDFSAPTGTPIMAAGKGKVLKASYSKSFGYRVLLEHHDGYRTLYAHLKGFAKGIKSGVSVKQGQIIGYLGNTGLSTSRHLHYEVHKNGQAINPLTMKQPSNIQLKGKELVALKAHIQVVNQVYASIGSEEIQIAD